MHIPASSKNQLIQQIIRLTARIEVAYPELYIFLDETPLFLMKGNDNEIYTVDFEKYLETLRTHLLNYADSHAAPVHGN